MSVRRRKDDGSGTVEEFHATVKDAHGAFSCTVDRAGLHTLAIKTSRHRPRFARDLDIPESGLSGMHLELERGSSVAGRVVDDATGAPVKEAVIAATEYPGGGLLQKELGFEEAEVHTVSDSEGRFALSGLDGPKLTVAALHPDYAEGFRAATSGADRDVEIRLRRGFSITGKVCDDQGVPAPGVSIRVWGPSTPVARVALADESGFYRMGPVLPGQLSMDARAVPIDEDASGFTPERKSAQVIDRDVEVSFGPALEHVTWRGTLFDYDASKLPCARIELSLGDQPGGVETWSAVSDAGGRFEVRKLWPGSYSVSVWMPMSAQRFDWGTVAFAQPGVNDQDMRIGPTVIRGVVVEQGSGHPVADAQILANSSAPRSLCITRSDAAGAYVVRGLVPGIYVVSVTSKTFPSRQITDVAVAKDAAVELRIELNAGGTLALDVSGFEDIPVKGFTLQVDDLNGAGRGFTSNGWLEDGGSRRSIPLAAGHYKVTIKFKDWGSIERELAIVTGQTDTLEIGPEDRQQNEKENTLAAIGHLRFADGAGLLGARITFFKVRTGAQVEPVIVFGNTDSGGQFSASGFEPGRWRWQAELADGAMTSLVEIEIPSDATRPFPLELVMPRGRVAANLADKSSGRAFADESPMWWARLYRASTSTLVADIWGGQARNLVAMAAIPAGRYRLEIGVVGYFDHVSADFDLQEGQLLDLGTIALERAGLLDLEVKDEQGQPVAGFDLVRDGKAVPYYTRKVLAPGKCEFSNLPLGHVAVTVKATGFVDQQIDVELKAGEAVAVRVMMARP